MKRCHLSIFCLLGAGASVLLPLSSGTIQAQTTVMPDDPTSATPRPTPRATPTPKPTPDPSLPVGTVNGQPVYRPLLPSEEGNPVNRALIVYDFNKKHERLPAGELDEAVQDYKKAKFGGSDAKLNAKLQTLGATREDFRNFVAEEVKVHLMLAQATRGAVSVRAANQAKATYVTQLRHGASINTPRP